MMTESDKPKPESAPKPTPPPPRPKPPRGPIALLRRRLLPWAGRAWALLGLLVLGAWLTGRILTDDFLWSQYLYWMPSLWVLAAAIAAWVLSWLSGLLATRMSGDLLRPVLAIGIVLVLGWMLMMEWRAYRIVRLPVDQSAPSLLVAFWNNSSKAHLEGAQGDLESLAADLIVITNPTSGPNQLKGLLEVLGRVTMPEPADSVERTESVPPDAVPTSVHLVRRFGLIVASRLPIIGFGDAWLEESEGADDEWRTAGYGGRAIFAELDASSVFPDLGRPLVVWVIDLPSDPSLHKPEPARKARAAIESFTGPVLRPNASGALAYTSDTYTAFPTPDLVVGDFNSPRGSASLRTIVGQMRSAHDQAGFGPDVTWDQPLAWWAIDLMFVGDDFRARRFDAQLLHHHAHSLLVGEIIRD